MGYLGSHLEDYYGFQLIEEVIHQLKRGNVSDLEHMKELKEQLKILQKLVKKMK